MIKVYEVIGYSDITTLKGSWRILNCVGEAFFPAHCGQACEKVFVDVSLGLSVGDKIQIVRAGKSVVFVGVAERSGK